ncbi:MAG: DMT family transporter [Bacillota bacterium]|nr:DMT family transporter [Bacillota bacterium]MDW7684540.1 DMT family transporter [Bacillota bacterium]
MDNKTKGFLFVILSAIGFGSMPVFARIAYHDGANVFELLAARFFVAWLVLLIWLRWKKPAKILTAKQRRGAILMGLCGYSLASLCFFSALHRIPAPLASIVLYTYPAVVSCLASITGTEKMDRTKLIALLVSFTGLVLVLGSSYASFDTLGILLSLAASLLYSFYVLIGNHTLKDAPLTSATLWISFAAAAGIGTFGLATRQLAFTFGVNGWLAVAGLALFSTVVAVLAFLHGIILVGASKASIVSTLEPLVTVVLAAVFLAEMLGPVQLIGGALVLASAVLVNQAKKDALEKEKPPAGMAV